MTGITGIPTFLINLAKEKQIDLSSLESKALGSFLLDSYDIENIEIFPLLFQTGYITVKRIEKKWGKKQYIMTYPNREVRDSLLNYLMAAYSGIESLDV